MIKCVPVYITPPYIWKGNFPVAINSIKPKVDELIQLTKDTNTSSLLEEGDAISTAGVCLQSSHPDFNEELNVIQPHQKEEHRDFLSYLYKCLYDIERQSYLITGSKRDYSKIKYLGDTGFLDSVYVPKDTKETVNGHFFIERSWYNIHYKGGHTLPHDHCDTYNNGPHYLCVHFLKALDKCGGLQVREPDYVGHHANSVNKWRTLPVETGDFYIFPGWLEHKTETNKSDEERIIMSLNITRR
ncbi:MAG: hypothetical protein CMI54_08215 [Parcubacteria group bacterium]|nr:hypothetical protein [Parcubacteria group bacterium]|tara:strand:+ start:290 stop:1018 length:729 start_codon:yes stop_codon:yes gene_type:complete